MARGSILEGEKIIVENIEISLTTRGGSDELFSWQGSLRLPVGKDIDPAGENYRLQLNDGRSGQIFIRRFDISTGFVTFQGSGELKKVSRKKWRAIHFGESREDRQVYERILAQFQQIYSDAGEPQGVGLYEGVDSSGQRHSLALNPAAIEFCS